MAAWLLDRASGLAAWLSQRHPDRWSSLTSLNLDLEHGTTAAGGVHIATLGGIWQALVLGLGGRIVANGEPRFHSARVQAAAEAHRLGVDRR